VCEQGDLDAIVEFEFLEEARDVRLHGCDARVEVAADVGVGLAVSDGDGDLAFAFGEEVELFAAWRRRRSPPLFPVACSISRRVIVGERIGSPAATARIARTMSAGDVSLSRKRHPER
jgi:hypothetical protein